MLAAIEETYPSDIAMTILKFCRHPTAELIKKSYRERINTWGDTERRFTARTPKCKTEPIEFKLHNYDEEFWNGLIGRIRKERERYIRLTELDDMRNDDYDAYTGNVLEDLDWHVDSLWWIPQD